MNLCWEASHLISPQRLSLLALVTPAGWGHGGWASSSLVPSRSYPLFLSGSCPSHCRCLWTNMIPAALQSKPGSSKIPQPWSTSSDPRSRPVYIRWPRVRRMLLTAMVIEYWHCYLYSVNWLLTESQERPTECLHFSQNCKLLSRTLFPLMILNCLQILDCVLFHCTVTFVHSFECHMLAIVICKLWEHGSRILTTKQPGRLLFSG